MLVDAVIRFRKVSKAFGANWVLRDVDLAVERGSIVVLCGPSGSGKSTLLRCINGLERIQTGQIEVLGQTLTDRVIRSQSFRAEIGMVFQRFSLYPHMTVLHNVMLAPRLVRGTRRVDGKARALEMLGRVGVAEKADAYPAELSGGQQQRVAIARALVMDPRIMLFDEPTSALDPEMIHEVLHVMRAVASSGMTMVIVTHEMGFAREVASRILFMEQGEIVEDADADTFFSPAATDRTQRFLAKILHH